jgi:hypothetical protein
MPPVQQEKPAPPELALRTKRRSRVRLQYRGSLGPQSILDRLGIPFDHAQQRPRRAVGSAPAMFPLSHGTFFQPERVGKLRLAEIELLANRRDIDRRDGMGDSATLVPSA